MFLDFHIFYAKTMLKDYSDEKPWPFRAATALNGSKYLVNLDGKVLPAKQGIS